MEHCSVLAAFELPQAKQLQAYGGMRFNVDVTGDRGTMRAKGADARGRPC